MKKIFIVNFKRYTLNTVKRIDRYEKMGGKELIETHLFTGLGKEAGIVRVEEEEL